MYFMWVSESRCDVMCACEMLNHSLNHSSCRSNLKGYIFSSINQGSKHVINEANKNFWFMMYGEKAEKVTNQPSFFLIFFGDEKKMKK